MPKSKGGDKAYKVEFSGFGIHRIDGVVREVNDAGVVIDIKQAGRIVRRATLIPVSDIIAHTMEGPGFVIANNTHELEPIAGKVSSEDETGITITDAEGVEIFFPTQGARGNTRFVSVETDDKSLNRGAVAASIARRAEREEEGGSRRSKKSAGKKAEGGGKAKRAGKRRRA